MKSAIILCAGKINYSVLPVATSQTSALVPINGKPVISWIMDDMIQRNITSITVVIKSSDTNLSSYLAKMYGEKIDLRIASSTGGNILDSVQEGLVVSGNSKDTIIVLGDTLIKDRVKNFEDSFVFVSKVEDSQRWCTVSFDDNYIVTKYSDKDSESVCIEGYALAGYYYFTNTKLLSKCVKKALDKNDSQLSDVLRLYGKTLPIKAREVLAWHDFGNIDNLLKAKRNLVQTRYFNTTQINSITNTITKTSNDVEKFTNEINWYKKIPKELQPLTPRIFSSSSHSHSMSMTQEYYGYPTLAELFLYSDLDAIAWEVILKRVMDIHQEFSQRKGECRDVDIHEMYYTKTVKRIDEAKRSTHHIAKLLNYDSISYNGNVLKGISQILPRLLRYTKKLKSNRVGVVIHGDLCFSNILFDYSNQILKLIDPRGSFGKKGIYGDARYDIAKLRHSIHGMYDYITGDMFSIKINQNEVRGKIFYNDIAMPTQMVFDELVKKFGYNLQEIKLIEGLLFVSMLPLHSDKPMRQVMFYMQGLSLLNEVVI